jgi:integrase/recombinase XerD
VQEDYTEFQDNDLKKFLRDMKPSWTEKTFISHWFILRYFEKFMIERFAQNAKILRDVNQSDIIAYRDYHINEKKIDPETLKTYLYAIKGFYIWLKDKGLINENPLPASLIDNIHVQKKRPIYLTDIELEAFFKAAKNKRQEVVAKSLYYSGLRVSELVNIRKKDIDFVDKKIHVLTKGDQWDIQYIPDQLVEILKDYCGSDAFEGDQKVFDLHTATVQAGFREMSKRANIHKDVTPHKLRHTYARHLRKKGLDATTIQKLLRHKSLGSTSIYLEMDDDDLGNEVNNIFKGE